MIETNNPGMIPGILMPLPDRDFDPTEAATPWVECTDRGWQVTISTENGNIPQADPHKLKGSLPGLLSASAKTQAAYQRMTQDPSYQHPIRYADIDPVLFLGLLLPGGDGPGMRQYLESPVLQKKVLECWQHGMLVGAICHGLLVLARTVDPRSGHSVLYGHKVTALPKSLDRLAFHIENRLFKHGYIMYSRCVADEVRACLEHPEDFSMGSSIFSSYVVTDGNLITSRWYMDAELFSERFGSEFQKRMDAYKRI